MVRRENGNDHTPIFARLSPKAGFFFSGTFSVTLRTMKIAVLAISLLLSSLTASAGSVVTYSSLRNAPLKKSLTYINQVQKIIKVGGDVRMNEAVVSKNSADICAAKKQLTCQPGLYGFNRCVRNQETAIFTCPRPVSEKMLTAYFAEPEFHRASWTSFAMKLTKACTTKYTKACKDLVSLKSQFLQKKP